VQASPLVGLCPVCGAEGLSLGAAAPSCAGCGATEETRLLAAAVLRHVGAGCVPFLRRAVGMPPLAAMTIIDCSGDPAIAAALGPLGGYRAFATPAAGAKGARQATPMARLRACRNGALDALLCRGMLAGFNEMAALAAECARILKPGGVVLFQERFRWPLPAVTGVTATGRPDIGADALAVLESAQLLAWADRVNLPLDPAYRNLILVGVKR